MLWVKVVSRCPLSSKGNQLLLFKHHWELTDLTQSIISGILLKLKGLYLQLLEASLS
jgi:hypothetical protein